MNRYIRIPVYFLIFFTLLGIGSEKYVLTGGIKQQDIRHFSRKLHEKQRTIENILDETAVKLDSVDLDSQDEIFEALKGNNELFEHSELAVLVTHKGRLIYWSDHAAGFSNEISSAEPGFVQLPNGWFVLSRIKKGDAVINGLILIKYNYKIENEYLKNTFAKGFHLPDNFELHFYKSPDTYPVYDYKNRFLFSIESSGLVPCIYTDLYIPVAFYLLALFFLFVTLYRLNSHFFHRHTHLKLLLLLAIVAGIYTAMNLFRFPRSVYMLQLFSPKQFAYSAFLPSLGSLLISSVLLFFWSINFLRSFDIAENIKEGKIKRKAAIMFMLIVVALFFVFIRFMIKTLIMNSSVSFAMYRIEELNFYSFTGFLSIGLLYLAFFFVVFRVTWVFRKVTTHKEFITALTIVTLLFFSLMQWIDSSGNSILGIFYWIILIISFLVNKRGILKHRLSLIIAIVFVFTLFSLFTIIDFVEKHKNNIQEVMAVNLSEEHDPSAEVYLSDIDKQIKSDTLLVQNLYPPYDFADKYLRNKYFGGYLKQYDLQFTFCDADDSVIIQPENITEPCFPFFEEMLEKNGAQISGTNFYYVDNMNGRITYFGKYDFDIYENQEVTLFVELNSKLRSEGIGFPELLLPEHSLENRIKNNFSFAKYNNGELVDRGGNFLYALTSQAYHLPQNRMSYKEWDGYVHCIYPLGNGNYILVSREKAGVYDYLITFPYIFVFLFILFLLVNFATHPYLKITPVNGSLRLRIQFSIIGIVFTALLVVGGGTIFYNVAQYKANHRRDLIDKINSVSVEIDMIMNNVDSINSSLIDYLGDELVRISDIFWTDVNIYDLNGHLIVSSRPDVFTKGLISEQMDNTAISYLNKYQPTRFLHKEHIAKMEYLSAYVPLINRSGQNIGYINLPYFTKEREFRQEITTFILAFINIYVFLLLASILVAYFISVKITDPLKWIRENLRSMQLGKETKPIEYKSDDEIGVLVTEYNNKVEELAVSAELLAKSERETAWREMAKQIAHEIKNPLTPMKLNIQFLQRSDPKEDGYNEKVKKVTNILIEQIDNLSSIATGFSNFARIPKAKNEKFELAQRLAETIKLYNYTGQVEISTLFAEGKGMLVYADKEQFSRAIINLIKNAIQAIPEQRKGKISISLKKKDDRVLIIISDNGKGISKDLKERIFVPNFTTKSSGAGLGLAITKNIVENFRGKIWFESTINVGTTFYIEIPLV